VKFDDWKPIQTSRSCRVFDSLRREVDPIIRKGITSDRYLRNNNTVLRNGIRLSRLLHNHNPLNRGARGLFLNLDQWSIRIRAYMLTSVICFVLLSILLPALRSKTRRGIQATRRYVPIDTSRQSYYQQDGGCSRTLQRLSYVHKAKERGTQDSSIHR
jgi:hypothetical protein